MKKFLLVLTICSFCLLPAFAFADGGIGDGPDPFGNRLEIEQVFDTCDSLENMLARFACYQLIDGKDKGGDLRELSAIYDGPDPVEDE